MERFHGSWSTFTRVQDSVVAVGHFDGVHRGHQAIIARVVESARLQSLRSVILAFIDQPGDLSAGTRPIPASLTSPEEKSALIAELEPDLLMEVPFEPSLAQLSAAEFVQFILKGRIGVRRVVIGYNHSFGKNRSGDRETLIAMSRTLGFSADVVNPVRSGEHIISSTLIRDWLKNGKVTAASDALGRPFRVSGIVVHGFGRGKRLNFPTANLGNLAAHKLIPKDGIYAGTATVRGVTHGAAISVGWAPTFSEHRHTVEAHLLDFDDDIYDEQIHVDFTERIRDEKKFDSESALIEQIGLDVQNTAEILRQQETLKPKASLSDSR